jgi:hypothetical protein
MNVSGVDFTGFVESSSSEVNKHRIWQTVSCDVIKFLDKIVVLDGNSENGFEDSEKSSFNDNWDVLYVVCHVIVHFHNDKHIRCYCVVLLKRKDQRVKPTLKNAKKTLLPNDEIVHHLQYVTHVDVYPHDLDETVIAVFSIQPLQIDLVSLLMMTANSQLRNGVKLFNILGRVPDLLSDGLE